MRWPWGKHRRVADDDAEAERLAEAQRRAAAVSERGEHVAHELSRRLERNGFGSAVAEVFRERKH